MSRIWLLASVLLVLVPASALAECSPIILEEFVIDPLVSGGGYYEFTVQNTCPDSIFAICIGNTGSDVVYRDLATAASWYPGIWSPDDWNSDGISFPYIWYDKPITGTPGFFAVFGSAAQVLTYHVTYFPFAGGQAIGPGGMLTGLRHIPAESAPGGPRGLGAAQAGSGFAVFGGNGQVLATGNTTAPVPVETTTWGRVKRQYAP